MKFRTFILPLAIAAGLVLVVGLGLLGGFTLRSPLYLIDRGGQSVPEALQFVPKQSPWVASVLARPDRLAQLWEYLAAPKQRPAVKADLTNLERSLLANTGLVYARDIQPWLGEEVTTALVTADLDQDPSNGSTPGYLVALTCRDCQTARTTLELFWQNRALAGDALTFEDVAGNRLIYSRRLEGDRRPDPRTADFVPLATTLVANRFVLVANHPDVLRRALRVAQTTDGSLRADPRYRSTIKELTEPRVGLLAINLPQVSRWLQTETSQSPFALALDYLTQAEGRLDWGLVSLGVNRQGIVADAAWVAAYGHQLSPRRQTLTDWTGLADLLPDHLALTAVGRNLGEFGQLLSPLVKSIGFNVLPLQSLGDRLDRILGTGATAAVVDIVDQPYGLGLALEPDLANPGWLLVSSASERLGNALGQLETLARDQGLGVGRLDLLGYPTTVWAKLSLAPIRPQSREVAPLTVSTEVAGLTAQVGDYQVLTTRPTVMEQVLRLSQPDLWNAGQPKAPDWVRQLDYLSRPSEGYVHLDWPQLQGAMQAQVPRFRLWEAAARPILRHFQGVTWASYGQTEQMQRTGFFLELTNRSE